MQHSILPVLGLTGGIATGKSLASSYLCERGAHVIDADRVGHQLLAKPRPEAAPDDVRAAVIEAFGTGILDEHGEIARPKLGALVFADADALTRLNALMHPAMERDMARQIAELRMQAAATDESGAGAGASVLGSAGMPSLIVLDAALLFEANWQGLCDCVCVLVAAPALVLRRLMQRNRLSEAQARQRIAAQWDPQWKAARADWVIRNDADLPALHQQLDATLAALMGSS